MGSNLNVRLALGAVPALWKWNERPGQLVIIPGGLQWRLWHRLDISTLRNLWRGRWHRRTKSGGRPPFEPSFKVKGDYGHNQSSGLVVLPTCVMTSTLAAPERSRGTGARALPPMGLSSFDVGLIMAG
jgi:hypothetical protein